MRVLVTRPAADNPGLLAQLKRLGHDGLSAPLLDIELYPGDELDLNGVQALLFTSANGARAFAGRSAERFLPALCVGNATAREAFALGFDTVKSASGDVEALAALTEAECSPDGGALLHPAGTKVAGDLAGCLEQKGYTYRREVLYQAIKANELPQVAQDALKAGSLDGVLLYSPRTGAAFARLVKAAGLAQHLASVSAYCLSLAVADEIQELDWQNIHIADEPDQTSLLALLET
ncbi:uroporphyrinogen-III synthase [Magnetovibrio sp. PR-2]|uniref:uroporphyrinogen-III synthase n=1 Tax=Magnetovibrio sp. PR-2 TaxID=3120356 RepID=UPI002FCE24C6